MHTDCISATGGVPVILAPAWYPRDLNCSEKIVDMVQLRLSAVPARFECVVNHKNETTKLRLI